MTFWVFSILSWSFVTKNLLLLFYFILSFEEEEEVQILIGFPARLNSSESHEIKEWNRFVIDVFWFYVACDNSLSLIFFQ